MECGLEPVDLVFDTVGGERLARSPAVLREGGRLVSVAEEPPQAPGITSVYFVVEPNREQLAQVAASARRRPAAPAIDSVFPLEEAASAFERSMASRASAARSCSRWPPDQAPGSVETTS